MTIRLNHSIAEKKLLASFKAPCKKANGVLELISDVISGTHLTYDSTIIELPYCMECDSTIQ